MEYDSSDPHDAFSDGEWTLDTGEQDRQPGVAGVDGYEAPPFIPEFDDTQPGAVVVACLDTEGSEGVAGSPSEIGTSDAATEAAVVIQDGQPLHGHLMYDGAYRDMRKIRPGDDIDNDYAFVTIARGKLGAEASIKASEDMGEDIEREGVVAFLSEPAHQDRSGIDFEAVNTFYGLLGMPDVDSSTVGVVSDEYAVEFSQLIGAEAILTQEGTGEYGRLGGSHEGLAGTTYVVRDAVMEAANGGARHAEELVFHERFHEESMHVTSVTSDPTKVKADVFNNRMGHSVLRFKVDGRRRSESSLEAGPGVSVEEAVVAYFQRVFGQWRNNSPNGTHGGEEIRIIGFGYRETPEALVHEEYTLPVRHTNAHPNPERPNVISERSLGSAAVELLVRMEPELFDAFLDARHDVAGKRRVAQLIDNIEPGLYHDMLTCAEKEGGNKADGMLWMFRTAVRIAHERGLDDQTKWNYDWRNISRLQG